MVYGYAPTVTSYLSPLLQIQLYRGLLDEESPDNCIELTGEFPDSWNDWCLKT
jgi:hypothetical protein